MQKTALFTMTVAATGAVSAHRFVGLMTGAHCADAARAQGVSQYAAALGEAFTIDVLGTTIVEAGGAISAGAAVKAGGGGKAVAQAGVGEIIGYAVTAATADGQKIEVLLTGP